MLEAEVFISGAQMHQRVSMNKAQEIKKHMKKHDDKIKIEGTQGKQSRSVQSTFEKMISRREFNMDCYC